MLCLGPILAMGGHRDPKSNLSVARRYSGDTTRPASIVLADTATPWSSSWMVDALPAGWRHTGVLSSVIANPADPRRTWWFWPRVRKDRVWFAVGQKKHVTWRVTTVRALAQSSTVPVPLRVTAQWVMTLETGRGLMPAMEMEPPGAFLADMGAMTGVAGWMASMGPAPHTMVLTWGLRGRANTEFRLVTLWRWRTRLGWHCTLGVLHPEPTTSLAVPSIPWDLRRWQSVGAVPSKHVSRRSS